MSFRSRRRRNPSDISRYEAFAGKNERCCFKFFQPDVFQAYCHRDFSAALRCEMTWGISISEFRVIILQWDFGLRNQVFDFRNGNMLLSEPFSARNWSNWPKNLVSFPGLCQNLVVVLFSRIDIFWANWEMRRLFPYISLSPNLHRQILGKNLNGHLKVCFLHLLIVS